MRIINVIGLGYIGLPTALMLSANGNRVIGTDFNIDIINGLNNRNIDFKENGLEDLFQKAIDSGIIFTQSYVKADYYIIAVPTPYMKESKQIDSKHVEEAVRMVLNICEMGSVIIIESTISPGTIDRFIRPICSEFGTEVHLVHAPERIIPGNMIFELENNARTIGADTVEIGLRVKSIYESFCKSSIELTDVKTAEMSKVVENTYRDINIAFANELAKICRASGVDVYEIIRIANLHPRVNILQPGPGVGGHCISVDPWFLVGDFPELTNLISTARETNDSMPRYVYNRIVEIMKINNVFDFTKVGLYGLTYKEDVDDVRESPTLQFMDILSEKEKNSIAVYDPMVNVQLYRNQYNNFGEFLNEIELLVVMVGHNHIKVNSEMVKNKIIYDTRNILNHIQHKYTL